MKYLFNSIILAIILGFMYTHAQINLTEGNLKGKVKSLTEKTYSSKMIYYWKSKTTYDNKGDIVEKQKFDDAGRVTDKVSYKYYDKKKIIEENSYDHDNKIYLRIIYKYNDDNKIIERNSYGPDGNYSGENRIFKYDLKGNQIEESIYLDGRLTHKYKNDYNSKGKNIKKTNLDFDGSFIDVENYKYDDNGNQIEVKTIDYNDQTTIEKYVYVYDNNNNWIKKNEFYDNEPSTITVREIEYYIDEVGNNNSIISFSDIKSFFNFFKQAVKENNIQILSEFIDIKSHGYKNQNEFVKNFKFSKNVKKIILDSTTSKMIQDKRGYSISGSDDEMQALFILIFNKNSDDKWSWEIRYLN